MTESRGEQSKECQARGSSCELCYELAKIAFAKAKTGGDQGPLFDTALEEAKMCGLDGLLSRPDVDRFGCDARRALAAQIGREYVDTADW